jgi:formylglycine-generating enzyme required for sulfatase activity
MRGAIYLLTLVTCLLAGAAQAESLAEQNQRLFETLQQVHGLDDDQMTRVRAIFADSGFVGQGNPKITQHPNTPAECRQQLGERINEYANPGFEAICGDKYMAPLYDPAGQQPEEAKACIDQFEFPNIPCEYPVVWVRAREAAQLCEAVGKRLCDAHEWEGACAGALEPPDYRFELAEGVSQKAAVARMREAHNRAERGNKQWAYGDEGYQKGICAGASRKSPDCNGGGWNRCGSNTYPAGQFPDCRSPLGVYDQHGNAAEHMNLPLKPDQMASQGSQQLGVVEMKGSWFIFDRYYAHQDWCRWRAPYWHGTPVMSDHSHHNYHLGFRCCKSL